MHIRIINNIEDLKHLAPQWNQLVSNAAEENLNYEPIPLISTLEELSYPGWFVVCVWSGEKLLGLFPLQQETKQALRIVRFSNLFRDHFMSCIPLVHRQHQTRTFDAFWRWFNTGTQAKVFNYSEMLSRSKLANEFLSSGDKHLVNAQLKLTTTRAHGSFLNANFDDFINQQLSSKSRSSNRNKLRKLEKLGGWRSTFSTADDEGLINGLDELVLVEGSGWKTTNGSAIALHPNLKRHMLTMAQYAASNNRFLLANAYVADSPVASMYSIVNNRTLHIYKIGFDEAFKSHSVGQLLLLDLIQYVISDSTIDNIDSCAVADSEMYNRCLPDQQTVNTYSIASNHTLSKLFLAGAAKSRATRIRIQSVLSN